MDLKSAKILIVDDHENLLRLLRKSLSGEGYQVICTSKGEEAIVLAQRSRPDVVILDMILPGVDGTEVLHGLRQLSEVPILVLSVRSHEDVIVEMLDAGADDYLRKPFSLLELKARLHVLLRRSTVSGPELVYDDGRLQIDLGEYTVRKDDQPVDLSPKELQLLICLVRNVGHVVPHGQLLREIWGGNCDELAYIPVLVHSLRQKIEDDPSTPRYIRTRYRAGYYFEDDPEADL